MSERNIPLSQMSNVGSYDKTNNNRNATINRNNDFDDDISDESPTGSLKKRIIQTIIDFICIILVFLAFALVFFLADPFQRGFFCDDRSIFYPYKDNTIDFWVVGIYGTIAPLIVILFIELHNAKIFCCQRKIHERPGRVFFICAVHATSLFILGIGLVLLLTEIGKRWVGRLRPHFMDVCKPDLSKINCTTISGTNVFYNYVETSGSFCTGDAKLIKEARVSFPSGHSSYACYTMLFLIVYLEARFQSLRFRFVKPTVQCLAFIAAYLTVTSRVNDRHHHVTDVISGSLLGIMVALFITLVVGRVLWNYQRIPKRYDYDVKVL